MALYFDRVKNQITDAGRKVGYDDAPERYIGPDPDMSAVDGWAQKYWVVGVHPDQTITLMGQAARGAVDTQEAADAVAFDRVEQKTRMDNERLLKAMAIYFAKELNKIDAGAFTKLTAQIVKDGIKAEVDNV